MAKPRDGMSEISTFVTNAKRARIDARLKEKGWTLAYWLDMVITDALARLKPIPLPEEIAYATVVTTSAPAPEPPSKVSQSSPEQDARRRLAEIDQELRENQDPDDQAELQQEAAQLRTLLRSIRR